MTDIVIQGIYGRMGHALIEKIAARQDCRVVAGVDREAGKVGDIHVYAGFEGLPKVDAIIDFSSPAGAVAAVQYGAVHGVPCVICSTGLSAEDETVLEDASAKTPIFRSANMSLGVNVLIELARQATRVLSGEFDIEIVEKHHHNKLDAPSGTALMIAVPSTPRLATAMSMSTTALRCARSAARRSWVSARCVAAALWVSTMCCSAAPRKC